MLQDVLDAIGASAQGWEMEDGYGDDGNLIAPDGCLIEQDGECSHGYVSPLRTAGLI